MSAVDPIEHALAVKRYVRGQATPEDELLLLAAAVELVDNAETPDE